MNVTVNSEPVSDEVRLLVEQLNAHLAPLSPEEYQFGLTIDEMGRPDTSVFVARDAEHRAVGCGALTIHSAELGEVKRMFTVPRVRGYGVGARILDAMISDARSAGLRRLVLETGIGLEFSPASRLYESRGFRRRGPFLDYPDSGWSAFYELDLTDAFHSRRPADGAGREPERQLTGSSTPGRASGAEDRISSASASSGFIWEARSASTRST